MATGVHFSGMSRIVFEPGLLDDRKRIDVGSQGNAGFVRVADDRDGGCRSVFDAGDVVDAEAIQFFANDLRGFDFLKCEFGYAMEAAAQMRYRFETVLNELVNHCEE